MSENKPKKVIQIRKEHVANVEAKTMPTADKPTLPPIRQKSSIINQE